MKKLGRIIYIINKKRFCFKTNSRIFSNDVAIESLKYYGYEIMKMVSIDKNCKVGKYVYVGKNTFITKSSIGNYVQIGSEVAIGPGEHDIYSTAMNSYFLDKPYEKLTEGTVEIGNDVWIGTHVTILRGVKIGNGVVIGAGAVVTKDLEPYGVYVGNPAQLIKFRFKKDKIEEIEKSRWWEYDIEEAKKTLLNLKV